MEARRFHLAEFNISRLKALLDSPAKKEFVDFLGPENTFAEESPCYVWRLAAADGPASSCLPPAESLRNFVCHTVHTHFPCRQEDGRIPDAFPFQVLFGSQGPLLKKHRNKAG